MLRSLGRVIVTAHDVPVRLTVNEADPTQRLECHAFMVEALSDNTGKVYVGSETMNTETLAGVYAVLSVPSANTIPSFSATISYAINPLNVAEVFLASDNDGEGALVSAMVA